MVIVAGLKAWNWLKRYSFFTHFIRKPYFGTLLDGCFCWFLCSNQGFIKILWSHFFHLFIHVFPFIIDIVGKGIPGPPLFKAPTPWSSLPLFLKSFFALPSFLSRPFLSYLRQFPHPHTTPSCPNLTNQPFLV